MSAMPPDAVTANHGLFAGIEPYMHGCLSVDDGHSIYYEQCGNPNGIPMVVLHGGPASGCSPMQRRLFDPSRFRIVLFDQRGCGRSTPRGAVNSNTTQHLLGDIQTLRQHLNIERWLIFGGSWGASLAIAYAAAHREHCSAVLLRGSFLTGAADLNWFFGAAGALMPTAWRNFNQALELDLDVHDNGCAVLVMQRLADRLWAGEQRVASDAASAWARWEDAVTTPFRAVAPTPIETSATAADALKSRAAQALRADLIDKYRVQLHYLQHECFLGEAQLLSQAATLRGMPVAIVHGRLDLVCLPVNAQRLHDAIATSTLVWVDGGGHSPYEAPMLSALGEALQSVLNEAHLSRSTGPIPS